MNDNANSSPPTKKPWFENRLAKFILIAIGFISLGLGIIGLFLPLLPTTPFLLLTAFCFAHGSERLYKKLISIPSLGRPILEWHEHGRIRRRVKWIASLAMAIGATLVWFRLEVRLALTVTAVLAMVSVFIWTRPE